MWPMQWPSSSKVARVNLRGIRRQAEVGWHLLSLLLRQLSGMPLRDTVVRGTRQSGGHGYHPLPLLTVGLGGRVVVVDVAVAVLGVQSRLLGTPSSLTAYNYYK